MNSKNKKMNLKNNIEHILQCTRKLNLYVSNVNTSIKIDYLRIQDELNQIKKYLNEAEKSI